MTKLKVSKRTYETIKAYSSKETAAMLKAYASENSVDVDSVFGVAKMCQELLPLVEAETTETKSVNEVLKTYGTQLETNDVLAKGICNVNEKIAELTARVAVLEKRPSYSPQQQFYANAHNNISQRCICIAVNQQSCPIHGVNK